MTYFYCNAYDLSHTVFKVAYRDNAGVVGWVFREQQHSVALLFEPFQRGLIPVDAGGDNLPVVSAGLSPDENQIAGIQPGVYHALSIDTEKEVVLSIGIGYIRIPLYIFKRQDRIPGGNGTKDWGLIRGFEWDGVGRELFIINQE